MFNSSLLVRRRCRRLRTRFLCASCALLKTSGVSLFQRRERILLHVFLCLYTTSPFFPFLKNSFFDRLRQKKRGVGQKIGRGETRVPRGEQTQSAPRRSKMSEGEDLVRASRRFRVEHLRKTPCETSFFCRRLYKNNEVVFSFFFFLLLVIARDDDETCV